MVRQNQRCAICGRITKYNLHVDHDHEMTRASIPIRETIRGLLCRVCNKRLLPAAKDDIGVLRAAIRYLERQRKITQEVLDA